MEGATHNQQQQPAAKQPVPSPPILHPLKNPILRSQLLAYCTSAQRLTLTQAVSPQFQQASLHPSAWHKVTCVRMCSGNLYTDLFRLVPPRALLEINMANLVPDNDDQLHNVKCARLCDLLMQMKNIRCLMLDGSGPFSVMHHLFNLLPKLKHLKHLCLMFPDEHPYCVDTLHTLLRDVLPLCDMPERLHLHIDMQLISQPGRIKHTIELASRLRCIIDTLLLRSVRFRTSAEVKSLVDVFAGVRLSRLFIDLDLSSLVQAHYPKEQLLMVGIVNKLAPGSLKTIGCCLLTSDLHFTVATGLVRHMLDGIQKTQLSQVTQFSAAPARFHGFAADIGYYNSCTRLTTTITEFLVKMPKLQSLSFIPCHALASPFVFETQPFMLMVQCFMQRAMQHKEAFEVHLTNVLDMKGVNVDDELENAYPCKQYELTIKHHEGVANASFTLKIVHLATERTLKLCID